MSLQIKLDTPDASFTNLDLLSGRVLLNLTYDETISEITVKLEGISKTQLAIQQTDELDTEIHKLS